MISYKYIKENILVPRNLDARKEKLRQERIKLLSQEVIEGNLEIDETFEGIDDELVKVKEIRGNVDLAIKKGYIPSWLKDVKVEGYFACLGLGLTSLKNCPKWISGSFFCYDNKLESLEGCPKQIYSSFNCSYNLLTSLEGSPEYVNNNFICSYNKLTSLEGCPKFIGNALRCQNNSKKLKLPEGVELKGKLYN